jgi:NADH-quinone oxidoreductase subunit M
VLCFAPLIIAAFWIGLFPKPFFEILEQPVNQLVTQIRPNYPTSATTVNASATPAAVTPSAEPAKGTH